MRPPPLVMSLAVDSRFDAASPPCDVTGGRSLVRCGLPPCVSPGVQFIWDCCCESVQKANSSPGSGCILAHCMGLGKTLQVTYACTPSRAAITAPITMLLMVYGCAKHFS